MGGVALPDKCNPLSNIRICMAHSQRKSSYRAILHTDDPRGNSGLVSRSGILPPGDVVGEISRGVGLVVLQVYMRESERSVDDGDKFSRR